MRRVFANELAPAWGDRAGLDGRALDAQHYVGHRLQPLWRDRLPAHVAQPIRAFVEFGQRTLRALQADLQRCADPDLGQPADRLDRAIPDPFAEALRRPELGALGEVRDAPAELVAVRLEVTPDRIEIGHVPGNLRAHRFQIIPSGGAFNALRLSSAECSTTPPRLTGLLEVVERPGLEMEAHNVLGSFWGLAVDHGEGERAS